MTASDVMSSRKVSVVVNNENALRQSHMNHSVVLRRVSSSERIPPPAMIQSSIMNSIPMVLTNSCIQSQRISFNQNTVNQSDICDKALGRSSKIQFRPSYVDDINLNRFAKNQYKPLNKNKKSGLTLTQQTEPDEVMSEKENTQK